MRKIKKIITALTFVTSATLLVACGSNVQDRLIGTWSGSAGSTIVLNSDNTAQVEGGSGVIDGTWSVKDGYLYIDRESKADLKGKIPDGDFSSITIERDPDGDSSRGWNTEIFTKQ
ncbi:hypothetical protein QLT07_04380 [Streptococcus equi subsp. zooepidemicus]|uniref:hypothetical protein n=1 Tax=Streptococcus equi TaxID=1336 RepID=UPI0024A8A767|nr:hypothetical protein [Streptococcus equi]MDI6043822.1 hypothetical protein [Streptococcus equi subsp. zooepidemicus]